jgi:hypothetical protein
MNVPIRALGIATSIFWIFLIAFIALAAYSIKDLNFNVGEPQFAPASNGQLLFSMPLYIDNRGFSDLKAFNLTTVFSDFEGSEISKASTYVSVIPHGENVTIFHNVTLDVNGLLGNGAQYLFNDSSLTASVSAGLTFAELLPAQLSTNITYPWGAPFYNFTLGQLSYRYLSATNSSVTVPMSFENHAAFDVDGSIRVELCDSAGSLLSESQTALNVTSHSSYAGDLEFRVPLNVAALSAARTGHFNVYFSTSLFEYGPMVIPYG